MKVQFDRYIPLAISNLLLEEDECASEWFQNPTGACAITLESRPEQPSLLRFKNGNVYIGEVNQGMLDGQGKLEMVTGVVYEGKFKENLIHGEGKVDWPDSSSYEGSFKLGLKHGKGIYRNPRKGVTYEGEWVEGKREGKGTLTLKDGSVYEGEFKSGLKEGKGKLVYPSGNFYDGSWKQGKKQGEGTMKWQKDGQRYKGNWTSDRPNGQGDLIWLEQNGLNKIFRNRYSGNFENNQRSGLGKFFYANGAIYEGEWKGNIKHGYGIYYNEDGVPTYGYYQNDKLVRKLKDLEGLVGHFCPERKIKINGFKTEEDEREGNIYSRGLSPMLNSSKSLTTKNVNKMLNQEDKIKDTKTEASVSQTPRRKSKAPQSNNQSKAVESIKTEEQKLALENHNEGEGNELKDDLSTSEESEALVNPYDTYLYIDDFIPIEKRDKAQKQLSEVFFRNHSQLRAWYKSYCKKNQDKYEEGFFMDSGIFFEMLDEMRLCNGRLNRESLTQMLLTYEERDFQLHFENKFVESKIKLMKRFDEEGEDYESFKTKGPEEEKKLEFELLLQEYQIFGEKKINRLSEKKPYLYKYFVNALLRAFYLKTGSITKLGPMLEKSFRTRIQPILNEKIRPKNIILEEENIIQRSKDHVIQFKPQLEQIYKLLKSKSTSLRLSGSLTFINLILLLEKAGYLKYSSVEDKKHVWMVLERRYDPEESMFKILKKIESRGGKSHYTIEKLIIKHYKAKLESSISCFEEFVDTFMVLFCKINSINSKHSTFERKLTNFMDSYLQKIIDTGKEINSLHKKTRRTFPQTQKDKDALNIEAVKEQKLKNRLLKKQREENRLQQEKEIVMMRGEDYDVTDLLAGLIKIEESEEEEESEIVFDEESYFENIEKEPTPEELAESIMLEQSKKLKQDTERSKRSNKSRSKKGSQTTKNRNIEEGEKRGSFIRRLSTYKSNVSSSNSPRRRSSKTPGGIVKKQTIKSKMQKTEA